MQWSDKGAEDYFLCDGALGIRVSRKRWSEMEGRVTTDSDKVANTDPTAGSVLEVMSLPPPRFDNAAFKEGPSEEKGGEEKYFSHI